MSGTKRVFTGPSNYVLDSGFIPFLNYLAINGWELSITLGADEIYNGTGPSTPNVTTYVPTIVSLCAARGIPLWFDIEMALYYGNGADGGTLIPTKTTPESWYETHLATGINALNDYDTVVGYETEDTYDTGMYWLHNKLSGTGKVFSFLWSGTLAADCVLHPSHIYEDWTHTIDWRLNLVDEVIYECYVIPGVSYPGAASDLLNYVIDNYPTYPIGIITYVNDMGGGTFGWWCDFGEIYGLTWEQQKERAYTWLNKIKYNTREFDRVGVLYSTGRTIAEQCGFVAGLNLSAPVGEKTVTNMTQRGIIPSYDNASLCGLQTIPPDKVTNTGKEIIFLKNYGETECVHDIAVSGTTKTIAYNITLSPDRGTPIGPFSVEEFGPELILTYDNTNMYISVMRDVPL